MSVSLTLSPSRTQGGIPRPVLLLAAAATGAFACYLGVVATLVLRLPLDHPVGDFFALWSYAKIAASHGPALLYDPAALHDAQVALGMPAAEQNPYPYPPTFRLFLLALQPFGYWPAVALWLGGSFAMYMAAVAWGHRQGPVPVLAAALAPSTAITIAFGQSGFLVAALLVGGMRLTARHPVAAGILFGLLTYKPQFGLLIPVALLAAGQWRCIAAATATALGFAALATAVQGWAIWPAFIHAIPGYQAWFDGLGHSLMPTIESNVRMLGGSIPTARALQAAATLAMVALTWAVWRRVGRGRAQRDLAIAVLLVATCIATPHGFVYDLPLLTGGVVLFMVHRLRSGTGFDALDAAGLLLGLAFPALMIASPFELPIATPALGLLLAVMLRAGIPTRQRLLEAR